MSTRDQVRATASKGNGIFRRTAAQRRASESRPPESNGEFITLTIVELSLGLCLFAVSVLYKTNRLADGGGRLGEALVIAGLLSITVERYTLSHHADAVAKNAALELFGIDAPRAYIRELKDVIQQDRVITKLVWTIEFEWKDVNKVLCLKIGYDCSGRNISGKTLPLPSLWLDPSVAPYESSIDSYLIGISRPNGEDELERLSATQLLAAKKSTAGIFSVDVNDALEKSGRDVAFAPASDYRMSFAGTMYLNSRGYVPLTSSVPVMNQDFVLSGTALSHLTVNVSQGTVNLTSKVDADDASSTRYTFPGLTPPGLSYIITWDQEESAELASRNGEIRTVNVSNDTRAQGSVL